MGVSSPIGSMFRVVMAWHWKGAIAIRAGGLASALESHGASDILGGIVSVECNRRRIARAAAAASTECC
jgi:predicted phage tail protein